MTIQQEAYQLFSGLSDRNARIVVEFIHRLPVDNKEQEAAHHHEREDRKARAFQRLQELRKEFAAVQLGSMDEERACAMSEKYTFLEE